MKKIKIIVPIFILFSILLLTMLYPKNIFDVIGKDINTVHINHLKIHHKNSIHDEGYTVESDNIDDIKKVVGFFKEYKVIKIPIYEHKDYDDMEIYSTTLKTDNNTSIKLSTSGDSYIFLENKYGSYGPYKIINQKLDINFIEELYNSLLILNK